MSMVELETDSISEGESVTLLELLRRHDISPAMVMVRMNGQVVRKEKFENILVSRDDVVKAYPFVGGG
jgi:thiamine biosynthesis protein ThiS